MDTIPERAVKFTEFTETVKFGVCGDGRTDRNGVASTTVKRNSVLSSAIMAVLSFQRCKSVGSA